MQCLPQKQNSETLGDIPEEIYPPCCAPPNVPQLACEHTSSVCTRAGSAKNKREKKKLIDGFLVFVWCRSLQLTLANFPSSEKWTRVCGCDKACPGLGCKRGLPLIPWNSSLIILFVFSSNKMYISHRFTQQCICLEWMYSFKRQCGGLGTKLLVQ